MEAKPVNMGGSLSAQLHTADQTVSVPGIAGVSSGNTIPNYNKFITPVMLSST